MAKKMHTATVEAFGARLTLRDWDVPTAGPGQILVKTEACGGVPHRSSRSQRGLAFEAQAAFHSRS